MKKIHKHLAQVLLLATSFTAYYFQAPMTNATAQNLVTFFSVVFGFYMTSIAILYNASYTKLLHTQIDEKTLKRGTHVLKSYLLISGYWSVFSITSIIVFAECASENDRGVLYTQFAPIDFRVLSLDFNRLLTSCLFGIAVCNIFFMLLLLNTLINGMIEEAKN